MSSIKTMSDIIRGLREDNDLNQSQIANIISSTQQQYSKYELGISEMPAQSIVKLADYYNVSTDYLLGKIDSSNIITDKLTLNIFANINELTQSEKISLLDYINYLKYKRNPK